MLLQCAQKNKNDRIRTTKKSDVSMYTLNGLHNLIYALMLHHNIRKYDQVCEYKVVDNSFPQKFLYLILMSSYHRFLSVLLSFISCSLISVILADSTSPVNCTYVKHSTECIPFIYIIIMTLRPPLLHNHILYLLLL